MYTYIPTFLSLSPTPRPRPSRSPQSTELRSLCYPAGFPLAFCFTRGSVYMSVPLSPPLLHVHRDVLYVCVSMPALQIGSSVPFLLISHIKKRTALRTQWPQQGPNPGTRTPLATAAVAVRAAVTSSPSTWGCWACRECTIA